MLVRICLDTPAREALPYRILLAELTRRGYSVRLEPISHRDDLRIRDRVEDDEVLVLPFHYGGVHDLGYVCDSYEPAHPVVNLAYEQLQLPFEQRVKLPSDELGRERMVQCCWGVNFARLCQEAGCRATRVTGHPRFDLYHPRHCADHLLPRSELAERYGLDPDRRWILLPLGFDWAGSYRSWLPRYADGGVTVPEGLPGQTEVTVGRFGQLVEALASEFPDREVIVRDHPGSSAATLSYQPAPNVHEIADLDVANWIRTASHVVVWQSTCAAEAVACGVPVCSYYPAETDEDHPLNELIPRCPDIASVLARLRSRTPPADWQQTAGRAEAFRRWYARQDGRCVERVADVVMEAGKETL